MVTDFRLVLWDFDGTLIPFDSEQFLLDSLSLVGLRALGARLFVYADRHGWDPGMLKVLYGWCLRQVPLTALEDICARIGTSIPEAEQSALRALATRGVDMQILSCGTADLSRGVLRAAGLADCFSRVVANPLIARDGRIVGIERRIYLPEAKVDLAAQCGIPWEQIAAVGDGITDLPLLDRVIATGKKVARFAGQGYRIVSSLAEALALIGSQMELRVACCVLRRH